MPFLLGFVNYVFHVHFLNVLCFGCIFIVHFFFMHFSSGIGAFVRPDGAFVRPDLSNECAIPNILKALRFRLHFHCIFLFPMYF